MQQPDHILIVDDDKDIRKLLEAYPRKHGFKVTAVANGRRMNAVISCLRRGPPVFRAITYGSIWL
jgi:DNA-binding response OmpR family regulator